jgi:hypothetical protein
MANLPPPLVPAGAPPNPVLGIGNDPAAVAAAAMALGAAEGGGGLVGEPPLGGGIIPPGDPPPPPVTLPLASPGPIAMAIWDKVPEALRVNHAGTEMARYLALLGGQVENPEALALAVTTTSLEPKCFLTARMNSATAIPQIMLVHSVGNYVVALGQADDLHGHSFAFTGEQVGNQLPSALLEPVVGAASTLTRHDATTPSQETLVAHYATAGASLLMPSTTVGINKQVAGMCMIPLMWAPYFIEGGTPKATYDKIEMLVAATPEAHRPSFEFIQDWGRYACVAAGHAPPASHMPSVSIAWRDFPRDRQYTEWAEQRFAAVYRIRTAPGGGPVPAPAPAPPGGEAPGAGPHALLAEAIITGMKGASEVERQKKDKYAAHEKLKILAACGLHPDDWDQVPPIYGKICEDGRSVAAVRASMEQEYHETTLTSEIPSSVFLSTQLVSDVKEIKFGWQESHAYSSSHRGISPFAVPHTPIEAHSALRALEEDSAAATTTTIADVRAARTGPPPCPTDYYTFLQMMCAYIKLLMMLFGSHCEHLAQVLQIYSIFQRRVGMFQAVTREQVGHLLWAVFIDARTYFSAHHDTMGNPPVSHLAWMVSALQGGSLPGALGTPLTSMFRGNTEPPNQARLGGQRDGGRGEDPSSGPPYVNSQVNSKIAEATANAIRCSPTVNFRKVLAVAASPKPQLSSLQLHRGGCFDYLFFGKCNSPRCTFQHTGELLEAKVDGVIAKMRAPLAKFVAES